MNRKRGLIYQAVLAALAAAVVKKRSLKAWMKGKGIRNEYSRNRRFSRAVLSLAVSVLLFCLPAVGFSLNGNYALRARAEENAAGEMENGMEDAAKGQEPETLSESGESVSGNELTEGGCICKKKCSAYAYEESCPECREDYRKCAYEEPNVVISIYQPSGWYKDRAEVTFSVSDAADTGNFMPVSIKARIGQSGSWVDVTEDKKLSISENCTVYVQVTDQNGNSYERSRAIRCFDTTKPALNAAVNGGLLTVKVSDLDSGAKAVYVNGYAFTDLTNGVLNVRLQQFDAGYEYFTIYAMDYAGNMSDVYKVKNPYYTADKSGSEKTAAQQLPASAKATNLGSASATVTEHTKTDGKGNTVMQTTKEQEKKQAMAEADAVESTAKEAENTVMESGQPEEGKEFYTIQTATDKVFYLIIDRSGEEERVYFLTAITENDLLHVTTDNSETLPQNSAALESAIPVMDSALPREDAETGQDEGESAAEEENAEEEAEPEETEAPGTSGAYILIAALAVMAVGGAYYFKFLRRKKEDFIEDEDEEDEEYGQEEPEAEKDAGDDFFDTDMNG